MFFPSFLISPFSTSWSFQFCAYWRHSPNIFLPVLSQKSLHSSGKFTRLFSDIKKEILYRYQFTPDLLCEISDLIASKNIVFSHEAVALLAQKHISLSGHARPAEDPSQMRKVRREAGYTARSALPGFTCLLLHGQKPVQIHRLKLLARQCLLHRRQL